MSEDVIIKSRGSMECPNCKDQENLFNEEFDFLVINNGPHVELKCNRCGTHIKFINQNKPYEKLKDHVNVLYKVDKKELAK